MVRSTAVCCEGCHGDWETVTICVTGTAEASMRAKSVVVMGGGVAGLATALLLAREGHRVTLIERDSLQSGGEAAAAPEWPRGGIPHFLQPHAFIPRGRSELRRHLPDVYAALLGAGAW